MTTIETRIAELKTEHAKVVELAQRAATALQNAAMQQARIEGGIAALEAQVGAPKAKILKLKKGRPR